MTEHDPLSTVKGLCWGIPMALALWIALYLVVGWVAHV